MVDVNRNTEGLVLPPEVSQEIIAEVQEQSVVMTLGGSITLNGTGAVFQEILSDPEPAFVGETERKPVSNPTFGSKTMRPHKIAVVSTYSDEFRRDLPGLFGQLISRLPGSLARTFDLAALHGLGAPSADFDSLAGAQTVTLANTTPGSDDAYGAFLEAYASVPDMTGWALSSAGEIVALSNRDTSGYPIFAASPSDTGSVGRILSHPVYRSKTVAEGEDDVIGIAGDWTAARTGIVQGVSVDISDNPVYDASGSMISAGWQDNMIAVRAEVHLGFIADESKFVRLVSAEGN